MNIQRTKWGSFFLLIILLISGNYAYAANEPVGISVHVDVPLAGIYKTNNDQMMRLNVQLKNNGEAFSGELVLKRMNGGLAEPLSYIQEFSLGANEEKTIPLDVRGALLDGNTVVLTIMKGGKDVSLTPVFLAPPSNEWVTGVLSTHSDDYHFLSLVQEKGQRGMSVKSLSVEDIPQEPWILQHIDVLAIGELPTGLTKNQVNAIEEWVKQGGILLVSGGPAYAKTKSVFQDFLPFSANTSIRSIREPLESMTKISAPKMSIPALNDIKGLYSSSEVGLGRILVISYDVSDPNFNSWQGNRELWLKILNHDLAEPLYKSTEAALQSQLIDLSGSIPGVSQPNLPFIVGSWMVYILVISPLLYVVLRKKDKREWLWVIIPLVSVVFTSGIYIFGKYQVAKHDSSHTASLVKIVDKNTAKVDSSVSFLMVEGGDYKVKKSENVQLLTSYGPNRNVVSRIDENGQLDFTNVPYLSLQQAYIKTIRNDAGWMNAHLYVEENRLKGSVKNDTAFNLKQVTVHFGVQDIVLGDLKKGESLQVDKEIKKVYEPQPPYNPTRARPTKTERMESILRPNGDSMDRSLQPLQITGLSEDGFELFKVVQHNETRYYSTVVEQNLQLSPSKDGKIVYPYGTLPVRAGDMKGQVNSLPEGWQISNGYINFALKVEANRMVLRKIDIPLNEGPYQPFQSQIYNIKADRWDNVDQSHSLVLQGEDFHTYISSSGEVIIRLANPTEQKLIVPIPYFQVEGVKQND